MKIHRSKERIKQTGEVFTPLELVDEMLSKLPEEVWAPDKTFLEPSCGDGNFLVRIVAWKIWKAWEQWLTLRNQYGTSLPLTSDKIMANAVIHQALSTTYAVDFQRDNVEHAKTRTLVHAYLNHPMPGRGSAAGSSITVPISHDEITTDMEHAIESRPDFKRFKHRYQSIVNRNIVFHNALTFDYDNWKATEIYDTGGKVIGTIPRETI